MQYTVTFASIFLLAAVNMAAPQFEPMDVVADVLSAVPVVGMGVDPLYKRALDSYVPAAAKAQTIQRPTYAPTTATDNGKAAPLIPATTLLSSNAVTPSIAARPIVTPSTTTPIIGTPPLMDQMYGHLETCMTGLETHTNRIVSHCDNANDENAPQTGQSLMAELQAVLALFMTTASNMSVSISQSISSRFQASQSTGTVQATHTMSEFSQMFIKTTVTLKTLYVNMVKVTSAHTVVSQMCSGMMIKMSIQFTSVAAACVQMKGFSSETTASSGGTFEAYANVGFGFSTFLSKLQ